MSHQRPDLAPVMDPRFNLEQVCDELALLQDHLLEQRLRCPDCITKHFIKCRALLREADSLDKTRDLVIYTSPLSQATDKLFAYWRQYATSTPEQLTDAQVEEAYTQTAQAVRKMRKELQAVCYPLVPQQHS